MTLGGLRPEKPCPSAPVDSHKSGCTWGEVFTLCPFPQAFGVY